MGKILANDLSFESIKFQNDDFTEKLEKIIYNIFDHLTAFPASTNVDLNKLTFKDDISILIYNRFKINVKAIFSNSYVAAIHTFPLSKYNVLNSFRAAGYGDMSKYSERFNGKTGKVDLTTAQVSGIFSEYKHTMILDMINLIRLLRFTVPEIVAAILHEVGHVFTWYEYGNRLESTNQVLQDISTKLKDSKPYQLEMEFREIGEKMKLSKKEVDDIINSSNKIVLGKNLYKAIFNTVKSQLPNAKYDETASEQLADNFAARFGYGRYLITGVDKIHQYSGSPENSSLAKYFNYFFEILFLLGNTAILIMMVVGLPETIILGFFFSSITALNIWCSNSENKELVYDDLRDRYKRVRQQYIEMIKSLDLQPKELSNVIINIEAIDDYIKNTTNYKSIYTRIGNMLSKNARDAESAMELQKLLEELSNNDLFIQSAKLKQLA